MASNDAPETSTSAPVLSGEMVDGLTRDVLLMGPTMRTWLKIVQERAHQEERSRVVGLMQSSLHATYLAKESAEELTTRLVLAGAIEVMERLIKATISGQEGGIDVYGEVEAPAQS